jgi:hypothetical protein
VEKYGTAGQATDDNIIRRMRIACWITKDTDTQAEYVILIASPRQQWLCERASMLRYTYTAHLVNIFHADPLNKTIFLAYFGCNLEFALLKSNK